MIQYQSVSASALTAGDLRCVGPRCEINCEINFTPVGSTCRMQDAGVIESEAMRRSVIARTHRDPQLPERLKWLALLVIVVSVFS